MTVPPVYARPVYIYALVDPETGEVRYIGQALTPKRRLRQHLQACHLKRRSHKNAWLRGLIARGLAPVLRILEEATTQTWGDAERRWIAQYRELGARLTNLTDGGDGTLGYVFPAEVRARLSASVKRAYAQAKLAPARSAPVVRGYYSAERRAISAAVCRNRVWTEDMRARLSEACRGRVYSAEARANMALAAQRRDDNLSPQEREARRQARRQVMLAIRNDPDLAAKREVARLESNRTPEFRAKISATQKGRPKSPEHRAKIGAAHTGKKHSPEQTRKQWVAANVTRARTRAQKAQEAGQLCLFTNPTPDI